MSKRTIKQLIGRGYLGQAIDLMIELVEDYGNSSDVENTLYNISAQYYSNESGRKSSVITPDAYNTTKNRLNGNLSDILDDNFKEIADSAIPKGYRELLKAPSAQSILQEESEADTQEGGGSGSKGQEDIEVVKKVLVLSSNPVSTVKIDIDLERARIAEKLEKSDFSVVSRKSVTRSRFAELIYEEKPMIVHFSGHGEVANSASEQETYVTRGIGRPQVGPNNEEKKGKKQSGIILLDDNGRNAAFVKASRLKRTFNTLINRQEIRIEAVILNACYSEEQAKAISEVGVSVIGTSSEIKDTAAIAFSSGFYYAIGKGKSIEDALDWAINAVLDFDEPEDRFILYIDGERQEIK